jgi:hypothetical protein
MPRNNLVTFFMNIITSFCAMLMEPETISETFNFCSELMRLIVLEDFSTFRSREIFKSRVLYVKYC